MQPLALAAAGLVLLLTVGGGVLAHELSHAAVLYIHGVRCDIDVGPERVVNGRFDVTVPGGWPAVTPREISPETPARALRLAAVAPLVLAVPFLPVVAGVAPDPLAADSVLLRAGVVGWLACAIPSPQDFSVFWHADPAVAESSEG